MVKGHYKIIIQTRATDWAPSRRYDMAQRRKSLRAAISAAKRLLARPHFVSAQVVDTRKGRVWEVQT